MGCVGSSGYGPNLDLPLTPRLPPAQPVCQELVVPEHSGLWGFVLAPATFSVTANDFVVHNQLGEPVVSVRGKMFSLHDKQLIQNAKTGEALLHLSKKLFGFHHTYYLEDRFGVLVGTVRKRITMFTSVYELYKGDRYDDPEALIWKMEGDFMSFRYAISDSYGPIAKAQQNPFSQFGNFGLQGFNFNSSYFVDVAPGVEGILVIAMTLIADEVRASELRQQEENRRQQYNNNAYGNRNYYGGYNNNNGFNQGVNVNYNQAFNDGNGNQGGFGMNIRVA